MSASSSIYVPGFQYNLTAGLNNNEWQRGTKCAIPVEDGFIREPGAATDAVIVTNLSGQPLQASLTSSRPLASGQAPELYNEKLLGSVILPHGTSSHFPSNPNQYIVSFETSEIGSIGKRYVISGQGLRMSNIANRRITLVDGPVTGSVKMLDPSPEENNGGRFEVDNRSSYRVFLHIVSETTAYRLTDQELASQLSIRTPDRGGKLIDRMSISSRCKEWFKVPVTRYYLRATDPMAARSSSSFLMSSLNTNNYVEVGNALVSSGQVVVLLADRAGEGAVDVQVKNATDVKFVNSDIVRTM